jgi:preprotein translocase subunit SecE
VRKIVSFLKEARAELGKVVWPTRRRAARLTAVVVIVTIAFGAFIGAVDLGLSKGVQGIVSLSKAKPTPAAIDQQPGGNPGQPVDIPAGQNSVTIPNSQPTK